MELRGTIVRKTFTDALDRPETFWVLNLAQPICVDEDPEEADLDYAQENIQSVQLVFLDHKMYQKNKHLVGKKVIATGKLMAGISAHHHTSVQLTVGTLKSQAGAAVMNSTVRH